MPVSWEYAEKLVAEELTKVRVASNDYICELLRLEGTENFIMLRAVTSFSKSYRWFYSSVTPIVSQQLKSSTRG